MPGLWAQKGNPEPTPRKREACNEHRRRTPWGDDVLWTTEESVEVAEMTTRTYGNL